MKKQFTFRIESLQSQKQDAGTSPKSMVSFAQAIMIAEQNNRNSNRLAKVCFDDETIHQSEGNGETANDTLIIATGYTDELCLSLWVDKAGLGIPVALCFRSDREVVVTSVYKEALYIRKLSEDELLQIFIYIFDNPTVLNIKN